jgi:acyl-CoA synthetase (AMP-forming)/AMP-acid ligase II
VKSCRAEWRATFTATHWAEVAKRARQVANALDADKLADSDRVATLAWNGYRHLEMYFGVSGSGRVLHTINPRLHPEQIAWIVNHAEDRCCALTSPSCRWCRRCTQMPHGEKWVALCDADKLPPTAAFPTWSATKPGLAASPPPTLAPV